MRGAPLRSLSLHFLWTEHGLEPFLLTAVLAGSAVASPPHRKGRGGRLPAAEPTVRTQPPLAEHSTEPGLLLYLRYAGIVRAFGVDIDMTVAVIAHEILGDRAHGRRAPHRAHFNDSESSSRVLPHALTVGQSGHSAK